MDAKSDDLFLLGVSAIISMAFITLICLLIHSMTCNYQHDYQETEKGIYCIKCGDAVSFGDGAKNFSEHEK